VNRYRDSGFLIVVDDFGCEQSNIDRLIQIHPDINQDRPMLISGIESDPYRQSILKSIHSLAEMTGPFASPRESRRSTRSRLPRARHRPLSGIRHRLSLAGPPTLERETEERIKVVQEEVRELSLGNLRKRRRLTGDINVLADWLIRQIVPENLGAMTQVSRNSSP
jgi:hypothetical protein